MSKCCGASGHDDEVHAGSAATTGSTSVVVQDGGFCLVFPRNRINPPLLQSPVYVLPSNGAALRTSASSATSLLDQATVRYCVQLVRIAPKRAFLPPHRDRAVVKLIRGETNEIPTTQAPSKAARSCKCPHYVPAIRSGSEGAIVLVSWYETVGDFNMVAVEGGGSKVGFSTGCLLHSHDGSTTSKLVEEPQEPFRNPFPDVSVDFVKSEEAGGDWFEGTKEVTVIEGETFIGRIKFFGAAATSPQSAPSASVVPLPTIPISHCTPNTNGKFGEVGVVIGGALGAHIQYDKLPQDALKRGATFANQYKSSVGTTVTAAVTETVGTHRLLKVPYGFEWGPFYEVDEHGHIIYIGDNQNYLLYTPHTLIAQAPTSAEAIPSSASKQHDASTVLVASVRLPLAKSELAGPHRHCYT